jgi:AraC-like DNA-binding protein
MIEGLHVGHWNAARKKMELPMHRNSGLELVLVENGRVTWDYAGQQVNTPPGHVSFSWPWQDHGAWNERLDMVELYWLILPLKSGRRITARPRPHPDLVPLDVTEHVWDTLIGLEHPVMRLAPTGRKAFIQTVRAVQRENKHPGMDAWGWMLLLFSEIDQALRKEQDSGRGMELERVRRFMESLPRHLGNVWTLDAMSKDCGMGRTHFATAVKHVYGDTPMRVLARMRVEAAWQRLYQSDDPVGEVADALGFGSSHYFATVFKRYTGMTPSEARERTP